MLGPTLFIILLNVVIEKSECRDVIGVEFVCKDRGVWTCPSDIRDENFWTTDGEYADDAWFLANRPDQLTEALHRLQAVTGPLGLDVSVKKTEWLWLSGGKKDAANDDHLTWPTTSGMSPAQIRSCVHLNGEVCKKVDQFSYLGSIIAEEGGVDREVTSRIGSAMGVLNGMNHIWRNEKITRRFKRRRLESHVLPVLLYGCETWNTKETHISQLEVFLNKCRLRVLGESRLRPDGSVLTNDELHEKVKLMPVHLLIAARRLNFSSRVVGEGVCKIARRLFFAEMPRGKRTSGRMQGDFRKRLIVDLKNLGMTEPSPFECFMKLAERQASGDIAFIRKEIRVGQELRGSEFPRATLQNAREMLFACKQAGCSFEAAEMKEVNRHERKVHPNHGGADPANLPVGLSLRSEPPSSDLGSSESSPGYYLYTTQGPPYRCAYMGCTMTYKKPGAYFKNHVMKNHGKILLFEPSGLDMNESDPANLLFGEGAVPSPAGLLGGPGRVMPQLGIMTLRLDETASAGLVTYPSESSAATRSGSGCSDQRQSTSDSGLTVQAHNVNWSEFNVPTKCMFPKCAFPFDGKPKSWKSWLNHCSGQHSWNLASDKPSRKRVGKIGSTSKAQEGSLVQTKRPITPGPLGSAWDLNALTVASASVRRSIRPVVAVSVTSRDTHGTGACESSVPVRVTSPSRQERVLRPRLRQSSTVSRGSS